MSSKSTSKKIKSAPTLRGKKETKETPTGSVPRSVSGRGGAIPKLGKNATLRASPMRYAPAAVSSDMTDRFTRISGDYNRGIRVHYRAPLCYIRNDTTPIFDSDRRGCLSASGSISSTGPVGLARASGVAFNPYRFAFQGPSASGSSADQFDMGIIFPPCKHVSVLTSAFSRFRHLSDIRLTYEPGAPSISPFQFRLMWTTDAANPIYGLSEDAQRLVGTSDADDTPNTIQSSGWAPFVWDIPCPDGEFYLYASPVYRAGGVLGGYTAANLRQSFSGLLSGVTMRLDPSDTFVAGVLFAEMEIELIDPLPIGAGTATFALALSHMRSDGQAESFGLLTPEETDEKSEEKSGVAHMQPERGRDLSDYVQVPTLVGLAAARTPGGGAAAGAVRR